LSRLALVLLAISGMLHGISLVPSNLWVFGFLIMIPVFWLIDQEKLTVRMAFKYGMVLSISFTLFTSTWLIDTMVIFGDLPLLLSYILFFLYSLLISSRFVIFFLGVSMIQRVDPDLFIKGKKIRYLYLSALWIFSEMFGWQLFPVIGANMVSGNNLFIQASDITGIHGISGIWFIINLGIYDIFLFFRKAEKQGSFKTWFASRGIVYPLFFLILTHVYGYFTVEHWKAKEKTLPVKRIALIQGNTPLSPDYELIQRSLENMRTQTLELVKNLAQNNMNADLIVWPESSVPLYSFQSHPNFRSAVEEVIARSGSDMIINDIYSERDQHGIFHYNNMWYLDKNRVNDHYYHKIKLLPFGEFMPLGNIFPVLKTIVPAVSNFHRGKEFKTIPSPVGVIIPSICYELLPPKFTYDFFSESGKKAQIIINITNDTWFGNSVENFQHLEASRIRAVEFRLPVVRSTNSGISGYVNTWGKVINPTGQLVSENRLYFVRVPEGSSTLFSKTGYLPIYIFMNFALILFVYTNRKIIIAWKGKILPT